MAITSFKRYEKKFLLDNKQFSQLIPRLLEYMEKDEHCKNNTEYTIYNIYYDTVDDLLIQHSISSPYFKEKLRLRSYTIPKSPKEKVFLELKKKIGGIVNKRRVVLTLEDVYNFLNKGIKPKGKDYISNQIINEIDFFMRGKELYPKVYIGYKRIAFFGKDDRNFRITFDFDIKTRREGLGLEIGNYGRKLIPEDKFLMEVKILGTMPLWLTKIFSDLSIYSRSFSKYGNEYKNYCRENKVVRREEVC